MCAEKVDSNVLVMQPANQGIRHNASDPLNWARDRRISGLLCRVTPLAGIGPAVVVVPWSNLTEDPLDAGWREA